MCITLCVCTYNRGAPIADTLATLVAQERPADEILVIDNNSNDATAPVVDAFIGAHPGTPARRVFEPEQGLTNARARAFAECRTQFFAFIDDDVLLEPAWTRAVLDRFAASPNIGAVGGVIEPKWESGPTALARQRQDLLARQQMGRHPLNLTAGRKGLAGAALALRTDSVAASGWPRSAVLTDRVGDQTGSAGDYEIVARLRRAGYEVWYEPRARCAHRIDPERQTKEYLFSLAEGIARSAPWYDWVCDGEPKGEAGIAWAKGRAADIRYRLRKTQLLEPRPLRRAMRIRERKATLEGYAALIERLRKDRPS